MKWKKEIKNQTTFQKLLKRFGKNENEIEDYFVLNGYSKELANKFYLHYQPDWTDSNGKKVKDWKKKAQTVWFKEENKQVKKYDPTNPNQMIY